MTQVFTNNAKTTLSLSIGPTDTALPVVDSLIFPVLTGTDYALVTLQYQNLIEIVKLVAPGKTGNTLLVDPAGRGQEGTVGLAFPVGTRVECRITKGSLDLIRNTAASDTAAEAATRLAADNGLSSSLSTEASTRATNDSNEASARIAADNALTSALSTETTNRINADNAEVTNRNSAITSAVNAEASIRSSADSTLQTNINNEALTRQTNDNNLQAQISALSGGTVPEIINGVSGTTYTRNHTGHVIVVYNGGQQFQGGAATLGWIFYFNGANINSWVASVNYQIASNPVWYTYQATSGNFTFAMTGYGQVTTPQFIVYYV